MDSKSNVGWAKSFFCPLYTNLFNLILLSQNYLQQEKIQTILGPVADTLGKATGFIKRKFSGSTFIKTLVFGWMQKPEATLEELVQAGVLNDIEVSAQGLDKRFTPESANFSRTVLERAIAEALRAPNAVPIELLNRFSLVPLFDTTILNLPDALYDTWAGDLRKWSHKPFSIKGRSWFRFKNWSIDWPFIVAGKNSR